MELFVNILFELFLQNARSHNAALYAAFVDDKYPKTQLKQCFQNIKSICEAANFTLGDAVKINVYYTDLAVSENLNEVMEGFFNAPYPARIRVKVAGLSLNAKVEIDGVFSCKK